MAPALDHLILLVDKLDLDALTAAFGSSLHVLPGGTHADGLTHNALITLHSGVYIELIAFVPGVSDKDRAAHWWGRKLTGWIDWCLLGEPDKILEGYTAPQKGGRTLPDGKEIGWKVTFPRLGTDGEQRGRRPFWCADTTPREWRVPQAGANHPSGASAVSTITLLSSDPQRYTDSLAPILLNESGEMYIASPASPDAAKTRVDVRAPQSDDEREWLVARGEGLWQVSLQADKKYKGPRDVGNRIGGSIVLV